MPIVDGYRSIRLDIDIENHYHYLLSTIPERQSAIFFEHNGGKTMSGSQWGMRRGLMLAFILMMALAMAACGNGTNGTVDSGVGTGQTPQEENNGGEPSGSGKVMTDALGHEVRIPANPQRILASYLEDHLVALGIKPVAQWSVANGKQEYLQSAGLQGVPAISYNLPVEEVLRFDPDFIIIGSSALVQNGLYEQYAKIAPTYVLGDELIKDWRQTLLKIGELLDRKEQAQKVLDEYDAKAAEVKAKIAPVFEGKKAAILWIVQKSFYMVDENLASGQVLYGDLGIRPSGLVLNLPKEAKATWNPVTLEKLAELDADYIFLVNSDGPASKEVLDQPIWQGIPAVKENRVYELPASSSWLYSGAIAGEQVMDDLVKFLAK